MSMYINLDPHSWYKGFAISNYKYNVYAGCNWYACTDDGNTYRIVEFTAPTLKQLKQRIKEYRK